MDKTTISMRSWPIEMPVINGHSRNQTWVKFDVDNNYPQRVINLVNSSPMQKSILDSKIAYMMGSGPSESEALSPNVYMSWYDLYEQLVIDYCYLGAFAVQCIMNESGNRFSFYRVPVEQVRFAPYNEKNHIDTAYLCTDWTRAQKGRNVVEIPMFGSETPKKGKSYLMYFKKQEVGQYYYAIPSYMSAANLIAADGSLARYYKAFIDNNFNANVAIRFPDEPDEDKKAALYESIAKSFQGPDSASQILLLFGENGSVPEIGPIETTGADTYNSVIDIVKLGIVSANRLTSPVLAGISTSTGFSSKSDEILAAATQYLLTVIIPERNIVIKAINHMLEMNGQDRNFHIEDFDFRQEFEGVTETNDDKEEEGVNNG